MAKPLTKTQLVAALAEEMGSDKKTASAALEALVNVITREVAAGGAVTLPGVGKIYCSARHGWCAIPPPASRSASPPTRW